MPAFPVKLVCPSCRKPGPERHLTVVFLEPVSPEPRAAPDAAADRCPRCNTSYPRIDGIRCVPPDLAAFLRTQAAALAPGWLPTSNDRRAIEGACAAVTELRPASEAFREALLPAIYALAHFPDAPETGLLARELAGNRLLFEKVGGWLDRHKPPTDSPARCALELGCGPGRLLHTLAPRLRDGAIGLDLRLSLLRVAQRLATAGEAVLPWRTEGRRFEAIQVRARTKPVNAIHLVQGDVINPPFEAEVFPVIAAISLLDSVVDPAFALGQVNALLAPGGLLLLGCAYHWEPHVTPPSAWWSDANATGAETLRATLAGHHPGLSHLSYEILDEAAEVPWAVPGHRRLVYRYFLHLILARKRA